MAPSSGAGAAGEAFPLLQGLGARTMGGMWHSHPHQEPFLKPLRGYPPLEEFARPKG
jgi:hypothetical protein